MPTHKVFEIYQWSATIQDNLNNRFICRYDRRAHYTTSTSPDYSVTQEDLVPNQNPYYYTQARLTFTME
jgi:hypothetical protein